MFYCSTLHFLLIPHAMPVASPVASPARCAPPLTDGHGVQDHLYVTNHGHEQVLPQQGLAPICLRLPGTKHGPPMHPVPEPICRCGPSEPHKPPSGQGAQRQGRNPQMGQAIQLHFRAFCSPPWPCAWRQVELRLSRERGNHFPHQSRRRSPLNEHPRPPVTISKRPPFNRRSSSQAATNTMAPS